MRFSIAIAAALLGTTALTATRASAQVNDEGGRNAERGAARRAAVQAARGQVDAAQAQLTAATERLRANADANPDMLAAQTELEQARLELDRVSAPSFEKLRDTDAYKSAVKEEEDAAARVTDEQAKTNAAQPAATQPSTQPTDASDGGDRTVAQDETALNVAIPSDDQIDAATDKLEVVSRRRQMEEDAARADPATAEARKRFDAATAKVKEIRLQMRATMLNDPDYRAAQERLNQARAELSRAAAATY